LPEQETAADVPSGSAAQNLETMANRFVDELDFYAFYKTSALLGDNVKNVFDECVQQTFIAKQGNCPSDFNLNDSVEQIEKEEEAKKKCLLF